MAPILSIGTWNERASFESRLPRMKCFIVTEGANTEFWYFSELAVRLARKGLPRYVELVPVKRTEDDRNKSHPRALLAQAQLIRENKAEGTEFEEGDLVLIVFDVDVFKGNER